MARTDFPCARGRAARTEGVVAYQTHARPQAECKDLLDVGLKGARKLGKHAAGNKAQAEGRAFVSAWHNHGPWPRVAHQRSLASAGATATQEERYR